MSVHLRRDLDKLAKSILSLGALVEDATNDAIEALVFRRSELADRVLEGDGRIDDREVDIEIECLKMLALHQPVAADLRYIVSVLKVNNDLERIGDIACNVAERARWLATHDPLPVTLEFATMGDLVRRMVRDSLDALVRHDVKLASQVILDDDKVDDLNREMYEILERQMRMAPEWAPTALHSLSSSRHLERIADLATNIAEDVIFMVDGAVVRHRPETLS
jgi:phosphate transport system protein